MSQIDNVFTEHLKKGTFRCNGPDSGLQVEVVSAPTKSDYVILRIGDDDFPTIFVDKRAAKVLTKFFSRLAKALVILLFCAAPASAHYYHWNPYVQYRPDPYHFYQPFCYPPQPIVEAPTQTWDGYRYTVPIRVR